MSKTYWKYISQGLCGQCGKVNDRENRQTCSACSEKDKQAQTETKRFMLSVSICPICKRERIFGDERSCPECRAKGAERKAKFREENREKYNEQMKNYHKKQYDERKENRLCTKCGKLIADKRYFTCEKCRAKNSNSVNASYTDKKQQRVEQGLCYWCGAPQKQGYKICEKHYQMNLQKLSNSKCRKATEEIKKIEHRRIENRKGSVENE